MRVLAWSKIQAFLDSGHSDLEDAFRLWFRLSERASWTNFQQVRQTFSSVDQVGAFLVFNIRGNEFRIVARVSYPYQRLTIKFVGDHREYDRINRGGFDQL